MAGWICLSLRLTSMKWGIGRAEGTQFHVRDLMQDEGRGQGMQTAERWARGRPHNPFCPDSPWSSDSCPPGPGRAGGACTLSSGCSSGSQQTCCPRHRMRSYGGLLLLECWWPGLDRGRSPSWCWPGSLAFPCVLEGALPATCVMCTLPRPLLMERTVCLLQSRGGCCRESASRRSLHRRQGEPMQHLLGACSSSTPWAWAGPCL